MDSRVGPLKAQNESRPKISPVLSRQGDGRFFWQALSVLSRDGQPAQLLCSQVDLNVVREGWGIGENHVPLELFPLIDDDQTIGPRRQSRKR